MLCVCVALYSISLTLFLQVIFRVKQKNNKRNDIKKNKNKQIKYLRSRLTNSKLNALIFIHSFIELICVERFRVGQWQRQQ